MAVSPAKASRWGEGMARARPGRRARDTHFRSLVHVEYTIAHRVDTVAGWGMTMRTGSRSTMTVMSTLRRGQRMKNPTSARVDVGRCSSSRPLP
jgi:hypothetical protein